MISPTDLHAMVDSHVGADGTCFLPYLHAWNGSCNVIELLQTMQGVFSANCPVYARPPASQPTPSSYQQPAQTYQQPQTYQPQASQPQRPASAVRHCLCLVSPLPSWRRHCLCLVCSTTAFVAKTAPFLADFQPGSRNRNYTLADDIIVMCPVIDLINHAFTYKPECNVEKVSTQRLPAAACPICACRCTPLLLRGRGLNRRSAVKLNICARFAAGPPPPHAAVPQRSSGAPGCIDCAPRCVGCAPPHWLFPPLQ